MAGHGGRRARRVLALPGRLLRRLAAKSPERLLIAPQDIRTSDPTTAADIAAGYFAFGGKIVNARGRSPFAIEAELESHHDKPSDRVWARQLAGFGWLRHLRVADSAASRQRGRVLVEDFLAVYPRPSQAAAWEPAVAARRLLAWLSQSPVILDGADRAFYLRFMQALEVHRAHLDRLISKGLQGGDRLLAALALAEFGLCAKGAETHQRRANEALASEIAAQVLPDGGHVSRNPQTLIDLLLDLLPLRQAYASRGVQAPEAVLNAIDRMMPMLRLFRHGDGALALFNGMGLTAPEQLATVLAYDDTRAQPIVNARYAGYQRLEERDALVLVDAGPVPPQAFSAQAHAGCLSFEFGAASRRLVVNCGAPDGGRPATLEAARTTAAHSTLVIDDTSSCRFATGTGLTRWLGDQVLAGPAVVTAERTEVAGATQLDLSHDGYAARFGLIHHRRLTLASDGTHLDGVDRLAAAGKRKPAALPYVVRFHLHPRVRAAIDGQSIRLEADGELWRFDADAPVVLEPSILFAAAGGARPTLQIKIAANSGTRQTIVWSFRRAAR